MKWRKNLIILQQRLHIHQENLILETHMKLFLQTALQDLKDRKDMMYVSRQERMSMDRRSN